MENRRFSAKGMVEYMAKTVKQSVAPFYAVAALWLAWALLLPLYRPIHYVLAAAASVVAFTLGKAVWPDKVFDTPAPGPAEPEKRSAGDPELDALARQRDLALSEMRRLNASIKDENISAQIDHLEDTAGKIIQHVVENPEKKPQISRFLNYYLPTTLKLLNAYDRMGSAGVSGANIDGTMDRIEKMMDTVTAAFDKQLDALFGDVAMDISTDITVMENLLAQEGLGGTQMGI